MIYEWEKDGTFEEIDPKDDKPEMNKEMAIRYLKTFVSEMSHTLNDKNRKNRAYAPEVFWKNKDTIESIIKWMEEEIE